MKIVDMIKQIEDKEQKVLSNPFKVGILPNDGGIIIGFPEAILSFDEDSFTIYTFDGLVKLVYEGFHFKFSYDDIKEVELGKYNFKDRYMKVVFEDDKFIAFNYHEKNKKYPNQALNMAKFFDLIERLSNN